MALHNLLRLPARALSLSRLTLLGKAAQRYRVSSLSIARRAGYLYAQHGFLFQEALQCGLLDPRVSSMTEQACVSPMQLRTLQERINPSWWMCLTEDKAAFFAYCNATDLKVAPYLAIFDPHGGWTVGGETLSERSQWERFFEGLPNQFVTKPALGVMGEGLTVYRERPAASELYTRLLSSLKGWGGGRGRLRNDQFGRIVIQPVLRNHSNIRELTGTEALQTARIVTRSPVRCGSVRRSNCRINN